MFRYKILRWLISKDIEEAFGMGKKSRFVNSTVIALQIFKHI